MNWITSMNKCTGPSIADRQQQDTMTAPDRAMHYMDWHCAAYGSAAPHDEVVSQLRARHGMTTKRAENLLSSMEGNGQITKHGDGWITTEGMRA